MASSLAAVDSNGVSQEVMDMVESWRARHENNDDPAPAPPAAHFRLALMLNMDVNGRDAEYIVECMRMQQVRIAQKTVLCLQDDHLSDEAIDVFFGFLRETPCPSQQLWLYNLPHQQVFRLLEALHTNRSVKDLRIGRLNNDIGASWIVDLLCHKRDFTTIHLGYCCFPFTQILPLLRGQLNLTTLTLSGCRISAGQFLFNDPESTQLFVDNVLMSPSTAIKTLCLEHCGVNLENGPLMAGFHQNTTLFGLTSRAHDATIRLFIDPILRRNCYLENVHDMLGTRSWPGAAAAGQNIAAVNTTPPPGSIWPTVLAKVGRNGTQGASPVFTILQDRLVTWIEP
jgi:hypothetical protein